ncbi:MAG: phosphatidylserine decarboxylase [Candidatus Nanohalarchaeota archaeon]|nr:MAG: phosphatidylserine decarboxylase [Candidatus Nanohaloarchaeota archaeon]
MKIKDIKVPYVKRTSDEVYYEREITEPLLSFFYGRYGNPIRKYLLNYPVFSKALSRYYKSRVSKKIIPKFVKKHNINIKEFEKQLDEFRTFNDFFIRKLKPNSRPIDSNPLHGICPADSKVLAFENTDINYVFQVKNDTFALSKLLNKFVPAEDYEGGSYCIFRLTPKDYHRFHFIDNGKVIKTKALKGKLYSVTPISLEKTKKLYIKSKKHLTLFESKNFGRVVCVEVGASCIGSIVQTHNNEMNAFKGNEKGYFQFGGSAVLLFFMKNKIQLAEDLLKNTSKGYETEVKVGEFLGKRIS